MATQTSIYYKPKMKEVITCVLLLFIVAGNAQTKDSLVHQVLLRISQLQSQGDKYFLKGVMPTYRDYEKNHNDIKPDNTIFTTGVVVFILNKLRPQLSEADKIICDSIAQRAYPSFEKYKNKKGRLTYNFWRTDTLDIVPNNGIAGLLMSKKTLPDDVDDTVMLLMALGISDSVANEVHALLQNYANTKIKTINNTYKAFKKIPAYSTWYGKKVGIDFDVCVLSNVLYFIKLHNINFTASDNASVDIITKVLDKNYHQTDAAYVAPYYPTTPLILYHVSRLIAIKNPIASLEKYKPQLIADAKKCYSKSTNIIEKIILQTTLMRLGETQLQPLIINGNNLFSQLENNGFIYFIANMGSYFKNPYKRLISNSGIFKYNYYCPAYNDALFLENLLLSSK